LVRGRLNQWHPLNLLLGAATLWALVQLAFGWTVDPARTVSAALDWCANAAAFWVAYSLFGDSARRERFLQAVLLFGLLIAVCGAITALAAPAGLVFGRFDTGTGLPTLGPFAYRNQFAAFLEAILPLALVRAIRDPKQRVAYTVMGAGLFGAVVVAASRMGAILCLAEMFIVPAVLFAQRRISGHTLTRVLAGTVAAVIALAAIAGWEVVWRRFQEPHPYSMRQDLLRSSLAMIRERPLTGFGLGAWSSAYPRFALYDDGMFVNQAHNDWVQWAAEGGVPFFLVMLSVAVLAVRPALRSIWGIGLLAVFVHALVDYPFQQRPALAAFFFALLGTLLSEKIAPKESPPYPS
jgi:O-antigen ligase